MDRLIETFANNLLPILLITGIGFCLGKFLGLEARTLGRIVFYVLSPVLVFNLLLSSELPLNEIVRIVALSLGVYTGSSLLAWGVGRLCRFERPVLLATILTSAMANAGNYGLPLVLFAFGEHALVYASIYFVTNFTLTSTAGVFVASLGKPGKKNALLGVLKAPALYALPLALVIAGSGWIIPTPIGRVIDLLSDAAIPAMLILLGLELQKVQWNKHLQAISISSTIRLIGGPLLALGLTQLLGISGPARQAGITEAGMPSAVLSTVIASEYDLEPSLVTAAVFVSTLLSPLTLTPLLILLGI